MAEAIRGFGLGFVVGPLATSSSPGRGAAPVTNYPYGKARKGRPRPETPVLIPVVCGRLITFNMPNHFYDPVRKCIYCGTDTLPEGFQRFTDEHIFAFGLGGNLVLQEASCRCCQRKINKQIETPILRNEWGGLRDRLEFPTRNPRDRGKRTHLSVAAGDGTPIKIALEDHATPVPLYRFHEARILSGVPAGRPNHHWTMSILTDHDREMAMQRNIPKWGKEHRFLPRPDIFARMIAKIAYGYAIAEYGRSTTTVFSEIITPTILDGGIDWTYLVGGKIDMLPAIPGGNHVTAIRLQPLKEVLALVVYVSLFSEISTPEYHAVVGTINFKNPEHQTALEKHCLDRRIALS